MNFPLRAGRSGLGAAAGESGGSVAVQELTACLLAVFNRQCISKAFLYMFHNEPLEEDAEDVDAAGEDTSSDDTLHDETNSDADTGTDDSVQDEFHAALIRGMKYGVLSPHGIGAELKPYMEKVLAQGYLKPADYESNVFATRAVRDLYPLVHAAWQAGGEAGIRQWSLAYSMEMLTDPNVVAEEAQLAGDVDAEGDEGDEGDEGSEHDDSNEPEEETNGDNVEQRSVEEDVECPCDFCMEMRAMDHIDLAAIETDDPLDRLMISSLSGAFDK